MLDLANAATEVYLLMLAAAAIGAFVVFLLFKSRLDQPRSIPASEAAPASAQQGTATLTAQLDACERQRAELEKQVTTLEARYADAQQQLITAQERLAAAPATTLEGGEDREHEAIQRLQQEMAEASTATEGATPTAPIVPTVPAAEGKADQKAADKAAVLDRIRSRADSLDYARIGTATEQEKEDLKQIKGVGPLMEEKLNALGIYTLRQVANLTPDDEERVSEAIEFFPGRIARDAWVQQAKTLLGQPEDKQTQALRRVQERAKEINFGRIGTASASYKDDLKQIKGIGPFIEKKLNTAGIYTFGQVSRFTPDDEDKVNEVIEFFPGRIRRDDWRGQAKALLAQQEEADKQA